MSQRTTIAYFRCRPSGSYPETLVLFRTRRRDECLELKEGYGASRAKKPSEGSRWRLRWTRGYLWNFNRFSPGKPCQKRNSAKGSLKRFNGGDARGAYINAYKNSDCFSLLLLLSLGQLRLLGLVKKLRPLFVCRKLLVGGEHRLRWGHSHSNLQLSARFSLHHAPCGGDIGIIAAGCCSNVLLTCELIYCRIETYPTQPWEQCFHPCMGCAVRRRMRIFGTVVKVPADVATGDPGISHECDHDVSKILTHALP